MERESWLDAETLIAAAAAHGATVTPRSLELWRYRGLLPRPGRQAGGRARWLYPLGSDRQLLRLLYWRERARSLELIRIALWAEGFPIELAGVRGALTTFVDAWTQALARERPAGGGDIAATIDVLAKKLAAMRSRALVPRVVRMTAAERRRAYGYMLALMFGVDEEIERRKDDVVLLERMLGLRSGRGGGLAPAVPLDVDAQRLVRLPPPEEVKAVIADAGEEEFEFVRRVVQVTIVWLPFLLPLFLAEQGAKAEPFAALARQFFSDVPAGFYPFVITGLLVSLHAKEPAQDELRRHLAALAPGVVDVGLLTELPRDARQDALRRLPEQRKARVVDELRAREAQRRGSA